MSSTDAVLSRAKAPSRVGPAQRASHVLLMIKSCGNHTLPNTSTIRDKKKCETDRQREREREKEKDSKKHKGTKRETETETERQTETETERERETETERQRQREFISKKKAFSMATTARGGSFEVSREVMQSWHHNGYIVVRSYWYKNCIPFPQMLTAFVAIDRCSTENGCMQELPEDHVALAPGDCLFFHCNLLHKSNANTSPHRRWAFLCAYNRASNNPHQEHHHPFYTPLETVSNSALLSCTTATDMGDKDFLDPADDRTAIAAR
ncbi:uncharacterized protein MONBRDRAFT_26221 [Monosiga brevicollis MX1]|uniref:Phytanoyl-CoA dioxygenase n=1 Tax=Monosiga brevicollis TaxID=81824 RepID=A9V1Q2_MONBE|nr:uncharacterized protein MONBRDRAFT_26221 [Monosiga brevicollis MX1]EDQ88484.1 predicted protein [Monosiga brevicollis MX1]|eukprot:XP_001746588.1 hypothetical protein [Monosiga brevicollis MX1]